MKHRHKTLAAFALAAAAFAVLALAGCSPNDGIAFSPDSKRVAFVSRTLQGISVKNLETGESGQVYTSPDGTGVYSLFWPAGENAVIFVELRTSNCDQKTDANIVTLKKYDFDSKAATQLDEAKVRCDENPFTSAMLPVTTNFDPQTMSVEIAGRVLQAPGGKKSPFKSVKSAKGEFRLDFKLSPNRGKIAFVSAKLTDQRNCDMKIGQNILDIKSGKISVVVPSACSEDLPGFFAQWNRAGDSLFYIVPKGAGTGLYRYNTASGKSKLILKNDVRAFAPFPGGGKLLAIYESGGSSLAAILAEDGAVQNKFPVAGDSGAISSLKISGDGSRAAVLYITSDPRQSPGFEDVFMPLLFDLGSFKQEFITASDADYLPIANIYYKLGRYDIAIPYYEKAGSDGALGVYLSNYYMHRNDETATAYTKLINIYGNKSADAHFDLGNAFAALGEQELAQSELLKSFDENMGVANYLVAGLQNSGAKAVSFYQKSVEAFKKSGCYADIRDLSQECVAKIMYADAVPYDIAGLLKKIGKDADAIALIESFPSDFPRTEQKYFTQAHSDLAYLYKKAGEFRKAYDVLLPVVERQNKQPAAWKKTHKSEIDSVKALFNELAKKIDRSY